MPRRRLLEGRVPGLLPLVGPGSRPDQTVSVAGDNPGLVRARPACRGLQALDRAHERNRGAAAPRAVEEQDWEEYGRGDRAFNQVVVRAIQLSRVALGELRPAGLCQLLPEGATSGRIPSVTAELPADAVLLGGRPGQGRAEARRARAADQRERIGLALRGRRHARPVCRRSASPRFMCPPWADVCWRPASRSGRKDCRGLCSQRQVAINRQVRPTRAAPEERDRCAGGDRRVQLLR